MFQEPTNSGASSTAHSKCPLLLLLTLFALSGAACLVYEVAWVRQLTTVLGASSYAVSIVLGAFMAGLGLGAWLLGRRADRWSEARLVHAYVALEVGIALYALLFPALLRGAEKGYVLFYQEVGPGGPTFHIFRLALAFALLIIPTTFMGATLPVLSRYLIRRKGTLSLRLSWLYAANTAGAILGTMAAGYLLLPALGIFRTTLIAVALNAAAAAGLWLCHRATVRHGQVRGPVSDPPRGTSAKMDSFQKALVFAFGLSGAAAMCYEVAWSRTLAMILGNTTFAFTTMLATFLTGIAVGSAFYGLIPKNFKRSRLFIGLQLLAAVTAVLSIPLFEKLPVLYLSLHGSLVHSWLDMQLVRFALAALVMLPPTLALGAAFPAVAVLLVDEMGQLGERLGKAYALNTAGAVLGAALAGLVLVPLVGMQKTILLGALANLSAALLTWMFAVGRVPLPRRLTVTTAVLLAALTTGVLIRPWAPRLLNSGVYLYASRYEDMEERYRQAAADKENIPQLDTWDVWELAMQQYELLYYNPGVTATVGVMQRKDGVRFLTIDGKTDASTGEKSDMRTQVMIGQLPLLLHEAPERALVVGLGSAVTAGSVLTHDVREVDCAEISPAVVEAAGFFREANNDALADPRLRVIPRDARNFLLTEGERYDVIISQPSNPWIKGEASLFAREWYELVSRSLKPGGMFLQWVPSYLIGERDLKVIAHTLRAVFPHLTVWTGGSVGDLIFLARKDAPLKIDMEALYTRLARKEVAGDLARVGVDPVSLPFSLYLMGEKDLLTYLYRDAGQPLAMNTDDKLIIEFSAPKQLVRKNTVDRFSQPQKLKGNLDSLWEIIEGLDSEEKEFFLDHFSQGGYQEHGENS